MTTSSTNGWDIESTNECSILIMKIIIALLSILFTTSIAAQELVVFDSISLCSNCNIKNYRNELDTIDFETDLNGKKCALLLVHLDNLDVFNIEGVYKEEYWDDGLMLWMPDGSNWITIKSDYFTPLRLEFPPLGFRLNLYYECRNS